jgi:CheY-like chemotaxis protein
VAQVVVLIADLLFGSRVQEGLTAAGHQVEMVDDPGRLAERLEGCEVLIVDLADEHLRGAELVEGLRSRRSTSSTSSTGESAAGLRTLGFYPHVDVELRERAQRAGFDQVVPRSRIARECGELVERLAIDA